MGGYILNRSLLKPVSRVKSDNAGKTLIIAEAGVNHNGNFQTALQLCDAAKNAGADVVKFQNWKTEKIILPNVERAQYQKNNVRTNETQFDMLKRLELPYDDFRKIKEYCDEIGIFFASTADDIEGVDFLISLGIPFIKIGSGDINNIPYLRQIAARKLPIILSTGMSSIGEVDIAYGTLKDAGAENITLLHCTTNYPCPFEQVNLRAMVTLGNTFGMPVGYSDHTKGIEVPIAAVALGASVIEKHITLNSSMEGPDHAASTEPSEFKAMVEGIRNIERAMGNGEKKPTAEETQISEVILKRIVAVQDIECGNIITEDMLAVMRSNRGLSPLEWDAVVGTRAWKKFNKGEPITL